MDPEGLETVHLEEGDVAAYVDRALSLGERARVEAHLADCGRCRDEVIQVTQLLRASRVRRRWYVAAGLAPIAPKGDVMTADKLIWSGVSQADGYRPTLFDGNGSVIWKSQTSDTVAALPHSVTLRRGLPYYWKVEARTGSEGWVTSELVEFTVAGPGPPK